MKTKYVGVFIVFSGLIGLYWMFTLLRSYEARSSFHTWTRPYDSWEMQVITIGVASVIWMAVGIVLIALDKPVGATPKIKDTRKTDPMAIVAFGAGCVGLYIIPIILGPVGIIASIVSAYRLKENREQLKGRWMQVVGGILSIIIILYLMHMFKQLDNAVEQLENLTPDSHNYR